MSQPTVKMSAAANFCLDVQEAAADGSLNQKKMQELADKYNMRKTGDPNKVTFPDGSSARWEHDGFVINDGNKVS